MAKVTIRKDEDVESLIRRFKRKVQEEGIMQELKKREYYMSPSLKRRVKSEAAQARLRKLQKTIFIIDEE